MKAENPHILLLAGTFEARQLARRIADRFPNVRLTASFAGAVSDLPNLGVPTRIGGFGGVPGLTAYLKAENVSLVVDATHPFAAQMSLHAVEAATSLTLPVLRLDRPIWQPLDGDRWTRAETLDHAADLIPAGARAFLSVGRKEVSAFYKRQDIHGVARMIEPPPQSLPEGWALILSRPPQDRNVEAALFRQHGITHLVTKNSGGTRAYAKLEAARDLSLPVIMIERPKLPIATCEVPNTRQVLESIDKLLDTGPL